MEDLGGRCSFIYIPLDFKCNVCFITRILGKKQQLRDSSDDAYAEISLPSMETMDQEAIEKMKTNARQLATNMKIVVRLITQFFKCKCNLKI